VRYLQIKLAPEERFELPTRGFGDRCSANWNYPGLGSEGEIRTHGFRDLQSLALGHSATSLLFGCGGRIRTDDLQLMRLTKCQLFHPAIDSEAHLLKCAWLSPGFFSLTRETPSPGPPVCVSCSVTQALVACNHFVS
jgi:hypothetical protein